jgi:RimJ/RimL family protein N-acetyltransferase
MPEADRAPFVLETPRLALRRFTPADADFVFELVNESSWIRFIGDKGVRSREDARRYLEAGPMRLYEKHGFGLWVVVRKADGERLGMCGLVKRDQLADVDLGFAFLPRHWSQGYARESAEGVLAHARNALGFTRLVAITVPANDASARLLGKLGFVHEDTLEWAPGDPVHLYAWSAA